MVASILSGEIPTAFHSIEFAVQLVSPGNKNDLEGFWTPRMGIEALFITPFYWGEIHAGGQVRSFTATDSDYPNYTTIAPFLGWAYSNALSDNFNGYLGLRIGFNRMIFSDISGFPGNESEIAAILSAGVMLPVSSKWSAKLSAYHETIFTYKRINLNYYSIGLGYKLSTPSWLMGFLE